MSGSNYGSVGQFIVKNDDNMRGDGGRGLLKVTYICNAFLLIICGVSMLAEGHVEAWFMGLHLIVLPTLMISLEFINVPEVMKWIPFYETNLGRGLLFLLLSSAALFGSFVLGFVAVILSMLEIGLHFSGLAAPLPLFEYNHETSDPNIKM